MNHTFWGSPIFGTPTWYHNICQPSFRGFAEGLARASSALKPTGGSEVRRSKSHGFLLKNPFFQHIFGRESSPLILRCFCKCMFQCIDRISFDSMCNPSVQAPILASQALPGWFG